MANLKTESQLLKDKWAKNRKCYTTRIEKLCEELKRRAEELEETRRFQRELETTLKKRRSTKFEESKGRQHRIFQSFHAPEATTQHHQERRIRVRLRTHSLEVSPATQNLIGNTRTCFGEQEGNVTVRKEPILSENPLLKKC